MSSIKRDVAFYAEGIASQFTSTCNLTIDGCPGVVCVSNDDDSYYCEVFRSGEDVGEFIKSLQEIADKAFGTKTAA